MGEVVREFTETDLSAMRRRGVLVLSLCGSSISGLMNRGRDLFVSSFPDNLLRREALVGQIAINPNKVFLPDSNHKVHSEHLDMINIFSGELGDNWGVAHAMAIMPNAPTGVSALLALLREDRQLKELESENYGSTSTKLDRLRSVVVGNLYLTGPVRVYPWGHNYGHNNVWAFPVVVPTR